MTEYTLDVNGRRYELNEDFRDGIEQRARAAFGKNYSFDCWWSVARRDDYTDDAWEDSIHEEGDPILTIETTGVIVPWDDLDQLEAEMMEPDQFMIQRVEPPEDDDGDEPEDIESGSGMKSVPPDEPTAPPSTEEIFGRTHSSITPRHFEEVPEPDGDDPSKLPPKPERLDGPSLVAWIPRHPDITHTWSTGETLTEVSSWVEWNVQQRADQPRPWADEPNTHDSFESLCRIRGCELIGEYGPNNDIPQGESGSVERKGKESFEDGRYGGGHWNV